MAMLLSYFAKRLKGDSQVQPPTLPNLKPPSEEEITLAMRNFSQHIAWPLKPQHVEKIENARAENQPRVASRLEAVYTSWAATRAAGTMLRKTDPPRRHPVEFQRSEFERGFLLARRGNKFYLLIRLFSQNSKFYERQRKQILESGFADVRSGELIENKNYPGLIL